MLLCRTEQTTLISSYTNNHASSQDFVCCLFLKISLQISSCFYYFDLIASEGNNISTLSVGTGLLISYLSGKASVGL